MRYSMGCLLFVGTSFGLGDGSGLLLRSDLVARSNKVEEEDVCTHEASAEEGEHIVLIVETGEDDTGEKVTNRSSEEEERGNDGLHRLGCLGVGKLKTRRRDEDLGNREHDILGNLPSNMNVSLGVVADPKINTTSDEERRGGDEHTNDHAAEGSGGDLATVQARVDDTVKERHQCENEDSIESLDLLILHREGTEVLVHCLGLQGPGGALLIEERPEDGEGAEDGENEPDALDITDILRRELRASRIDPVVTLGRNVGGNHAVLVNKRGYV